jgi:hypothetical protein
MTPRRLRPFAAAAAAAGLAFGPAPSAARSDLTHTSGGTAAAAPTSSTLLAVKQRLVTAVSSTGRYLTWEQTGLESTSAVEVAERDLVTRRTTTLTSSVVAGRGIATTSQWVVYTRSNGIHQELVGVRRDGSRAVVLSRAVIAPIDSRDDRVAWAEQVGSRQRVVVRALANGRDWVAATMPSCSGRRCYRIDAVILADDGVVFDRGAIGPQPSLIVRRRFRDARPSSVKVPNDPQPDLARSSAGAFYYQLGRGWVRWDFARARPKLTRLVGSAPPQVLDQEGNRLLILTGRHCSRRLVLILPSRRQRALPPPATPPSVPKGFGPICRQLTAFSWSGDRLLSAWLFIPRVSLDGHTDVGLVGVVAAERVPH